MTSKRPSRRWWQLTLGLAVAVAAFVGLRDRLPDPGDLLTTLSTVDGWWVRVAVLAGLASQVALGEQQRLLLAGFGVRLPRRTAVAMTVAGSAISGALPAGGAISAAFTFQIFRRHGATPGTAAAVTVLSGAVSAVTLILLYAASWLAVPRTRLDIWRHPVALAGLATVLICAAIAARRPPAPSLTTRLRQPSVATRLRVPSSVTRLRLPSFATRLRVSSSVIRLRMSPFTARLRPRSLVARLRVSSLATRLRVSSCATRLRVSPLAARLASGLRLDRALGAAGGTWRQVRAVPARIWASTLVVALVNWAANLLCLIAAAAACHAELSGAQLSLIYLAVQVLRQIPLTPGGTGLIEAGMLAAMIAAGCPEPVAAAVVLVYRLASFWLLLPLGLAGYLALRSRSTEPAAGQPECVDEQRASLEETTELTPAAHPQLRKGMVEMRTHRPR
ncbi:lysylphosphatidylglycerol synthase transmembrane domain-containing protein [Symbioplanes lichenis]|uniref:lysylphosphatidylglycerol synthase transmembrane domain-containing protein n=1 Tax=Symbioplanes lichenis TaxID=1629072 RepID=UPI00273874D8|nr:lysylphosphatidylglycerol synthase transmembrane domain-containing protein [Actinoplanes lichenis]